MSTAKPGFHSFQLPTTAIVWRPRVLWRVSACEEFLNCNRNDVLARVQDGRIAWCFCFSAPNQRSRDLRCLAASVFEAAGKPTGLKKPTREMSFDEVMDLIWPYRRDLRGVEIQKLFGCPPSTVRQIAGRGGLKISVPAAQLDGPNSSHKFSRASLVEFLRKGRVL
jgi:hypothetical protein